jgi:hypothetical protein
MGGDLACQIISPGGGEHEKPPQLRTMTDEATRLMSDAEMHASERLASGSFVEVGGGVRGVVVFVRRNITRPFGFPDADQRPQSIISARGASPKPPWLCGSLHRAKDRHVLTLSTQDQGLIAVLGLLDKL